MGIPSILAQQPTHIIRTACTVRTSTTITMSAENLQDAPAGEFQDNSYVSRSGNKSEPLPVQSDGDKIEDPVDENVADTDAQLGQSLLDWNTAVLVTNYRNRA